MSLVGREIYPDVSKQFFSEVVATGKTTDISEALSPMCRANPSALPSFGGPLVPTCFLLSPHRRSYDLISRSTHTLIYHVCHVQLLSYMILDVRMRTWLVWTWYAYITSNHKLWSLRSCSSAAGREIYNLLHLHLLAIIMIIIIIFLLLLFVLSLSFPFPVVVFFFFFLVVRSKPRGSLMSRAAANSCGQPETVCPRDSHSATPWTPSRNIQNQFYRYMMQYRCTTVLYQITHMDVYTNSSTICMCTCDLTLSLSLSRSLRCTFYTRSI